jgi:hypothetical protein
VRETRSDEAAGEEAGGAGVKGGGAGDDEKSLFSEKKLDCCPMAIVWDAARNERGPERDNMSEIMVMVRPSGS